MITANLKWTGKRQLVGVGGISGHSIVLDQAKDKGDDSGMRPTEALLISIAACTAVDMVNILTKMRIDLTRVEIDIEGEQAEDYPKYFQTFRIKYKLSGEGLTMRRAEKAVSLSMNKYCAISQSLKGKAEFKTEIEII